MDFLIVNQDDKDLAQYKNDMQESFQKGYEDAFGKTDEWILPTKDIDASLQAEGSVAYKILIDGKMIGGAIVVINEKTQHNHLDFLYVKFDARSKGIGKEIWDGIESLHPETKVWETCTPYFEVVNIHFYVNKCKFQIVEFIHPKHSNTDEQTDLITNASEGMFVFRKQM